MKRKMYFSIVMREHNGLWHETRRVFLPSPISAMDAIEIIREVVVAILHAISED